MFHLIILIQDIDYGINSGMKVQNDSMKSLDQLNCSV